MHLHRSHCPRSIEEEEVRVQAQEEDEDKEEEKIMRSEMMLQIRHIEIIYSLLFV